ncbi:Hypothetical predicted protein [Lecanosticta acicola]|uniref:Uncharacterized protein n=1 Tax=Lecanosticta acicola TaxID=111012 RepID=A0AAI9E7L8_9PEZI|nr:Hypothetical predicted protein [Lecanosticta acicola]
MPSHASNHEPAHTYADDLTAQLARTTLANDREADNNSNNMAEATSRSGETATQEECPLFKLPGEVRNHIYGYALSMEGKIVVRGRSWNFRTHTVPSLAQTSRRLYKEAMAIFYDCNTFQLKTLVDIQKWEPFKTGTSSSVNSFSHWLHLELESSIRYHHTLRQYGLQPTNLFDEKISDSEIADLKARGDSQILASVTVVWATHEKILASLAEQPRRRPFLSVRDLEMAAAARKPGWKEVLLLMTGGDSG